MAKFRKKPVVIEARQLTKESWHECREWLGGSCRGGVSGKSDRFGQTPKAQLFIITLEGDHTAMEGDWIIKGVKGEFYPCKPDIFEMTYEEVSE